jgi:hypothetical protein
MKNTTHDSNLAVNFIVAFVVVSTALGMISALSLLELTSPVSDILKDAVPLNIPDNTNKLVSHIF